MGALLVALAALAWGVSGGIAGLLMGQGWEAFLVSFHRGAIRLLFVLIWLVLRPGGSGLADPRLWFWSVIAGLGVTGNFAFYFLSISQGSVAVAATLMYCAPVFVYLVSFTLKLERPTALKWLAIGVVMVGIALLTRIHDIGAGGVTPLGVGAGLAAGLAYAVFIFGFKYAGAHGSPQAVLSISFAVLVAVLLWPGEGGQLAAVLRSEVWPLFLVLGVMGAGLSFVAYVLGLRRTAPSLAAMIAMVEPVSATLFGVLVLGEALGGLQVIGMILIVGAVTGLSVRLPQSAGRKAG